MQLSLSLRVQSGYSLAVCGAVGDALFSPIGMAFGFAGGGAAASGVVSGAGAALSGCITALPGGVVAAPGGVSGMGGVVWAKANPLHTSAEATIKAFMIALHGC